MVDCLINKSNFNRKSSNRKSFNLSNRKYLQDD